MTAKVALIQALLEGRVLNVRNCFKEIGLTNIAREIPRSVEKPFEVRISRVEKTGRNRYGTTITYTDYRLNRAQYNSEGIRKMKDYVKQHKHAC